MSDERKPLVSFYSTIDLSFLDDFDVKGFERKCEVDDMELELRVDAYIRWLEGQTPQR